MQLQKAKNLTKNCSFLTQALNPNSFLEEAGRGSEVSFLPFFPEEMGVLLKGNCHFPFEDTACPIVTAPLQAK